MMYEGYLILLYQVLADIPKQKQKTKKKKKEGQKKKLKANK